MAVPTLVVYHRACPDGTAALWAFMRHAAESKLEPELAPADAGRVPSDLNWVGKHVVMLDISVPKHVLMSIAARAADVLILDHHESARVELLEGAGPAFPPNVSIVFDAKRCAAQLAWDRYFPGAAAPWFIDVVADRDLHTWTKPSSRPLSKYLFEKDFFSDHARLTPLVDWTAAQIEEARVAGQVMLDFDLKHVEHYAASAVPCDLATSERTYRVLLVGCPHFYASDVGNLLATRGDCDFAVAWRYSFEADEWYLSCRGDRKSRPDLDLSLVCRSFGGGGHPAAAGFTLKNSSLGLRALFRPVTATTTKKPGAK